MGKKMIAILKGMARTMDIAPSDPPPLPTMDRAERLRRPWERTGQAIRNSIAKYDREKSPK